MSRRRRYNPGSCPQTQGPHRDVKFAIFDHIEDIPGTPTSQLFKDRLALIQTADEAGFAGAVPIEHTWFGDEWHESRERFADVLGMIERALRTGEVSTEDSRF